MLMEKHRETSAQLVDSLAPVDGPVVDLTDQIDLSDSGANADGNDAANNVGATTEGSSPAETPEGPREF